MENYAENMHWKLVSDPFLIFLMQNSHYMQYILLEKRYFERGLSKRIKKVNFFFLLNPVPFNGQSYQKQKRPGTSDLSLFSSEKFLY